MTPLFKNTWKYRAVGLLLAAGIAQAEPLPPVCQGEFTEARVLAALPRAVQSILDGQGSSDERFVLGAVNSDCVVVAVARSGRPVAIRARVFTNGPGGWSERTMTADPYPDPPRSKAELVAVFR
jgi:hypothetical protein